MLLFGVFLFQLDRQLQQRLSQGWFLPPVEFYTATKVIRLEVDTTSFPPFSTSSWISRFRHWGWRARERGQPIYAGDFLHLGGKECYDALPQMDGFEEPSECLGFWAPGQASGQWLVLLNSNLVGLYSLAGEKLNQVQIPGERFAQFYQDQPILRTVVDLGAVPLYCAQAVTAIEDADFLSHRGISLSGILRAMGRNLSKARFAEGASTITQQLVKNYFLTSEKTLRRKFTEQVMAILLELRVDKDQILSNYLNVIYMGQQGSFQVRGFAAASDHYFGKSLSDLSLSECALLAAIINNPGRFNPLKQEANARHRRSLVLSRMQQLEMITTEERDQADQTPLGAVPNTLLSEPAPYFVQAVLEDVKSLGLNAEQGLKIETTLEPELQERAQVVVAQELNRLESQFSRLKARTAASALQGAAILVDVKTAGVRALVGGRQYKQNQFNRVRSSRRQPGSLFKPLVYLAALETGDFKADSLLQDEPWTYKYEGQSWTPRNYDKKFRGSVTMTQALAESLNVPTARLAIEVGLSSVVELASRLGIESELNPLPALALGAAEVTPWELAQAYLTLAKQGEKLKLHLITRIENSAKDLIYEYQPTPEQVVRQDLVQELQHMLQNTFVNGTAQSVGHRIPDILNSNQPPMGKTGTTSDTRDAWFAGFDQNLLGLTWVGFDDNTSSGLTGASAALPIWYRLQYGR